MSAAEILPITDLQRKQAWLAERRTCITGTDVAAILGLSKFAGPIDVYLGKKNLIEKPDNEAMEFGRRFERPILEAYADRFGQPIEFAQPWTLIKVPGFDLLGASLDARWTNGDRRPVDAKNTGFKGPDWGEPGTDVFPIYYQLQLHVQMMATDEPGFVTPASDLAVCFGGHELARYTMHRDTELDVELKGRVAAWWQKHIIADIPPEPDGSDSYTNYLKAKFNRASELTRPATVEANAWAAKLRNASEALKAAEKVKTEAENWLKSYLGEASAIPGICTWRNNKDSEVTDWKAVASEFFARVGSEVYDAAVAANTITKPGARVFRTSK
jgi:putative phage-type endonuclease